MATSMEQIGTPVGRGQLVDPALATSTNNNGSSHIDALVFGATKDLASMRSALKALDSGLYTDAYLNSLTANDMLFCIMSDQAGIVTALTPPAG